MNAAREQGARARGIAGCNPDAVCGAKRLLNQSADGDAAALLIDSLRTLSETFPDLPVHFSTEGLGGSLRRLRGGIEAPLIPIDGILRW
ncbi:hypothetical protein D9M72_652430 [compost metagenome]